MLVTLARIVCSMWLPEFWITGKNYAIELNFVGSLRGFSSDLRALTDSSCDFCFVSRSLGLSRISSVIVLIILEQDSISISSAVKLKACLSARLPCFVLALVEISHERFDCRLLLLAELFNWNRQLHDALAILLIRLRKIIQENESLKWILG